MSEAKSFRKQVLALLGESYGDRTLVLCPTPFVKLLNGDHKAAILLSQILYWSDRTKDAEGWFYKSYADWTTETGLSEAQVRRIVKGDVRVQGPRVTLRDLGVETKLKKVRATGAPTLHYRINQAQLLNQLNGLMGQGDSSQCSESTPNIAEDEPLCLAGLHPEQSAGSLDPETTTPDQQTEEQLHHNPAHHPDEDSDLGIFLPYTKRFGKFKSELAKTFRDELARLGAGRVGEVLERCAKTGRSWNYVWRALANEAAVFPETGLETHWTGSTAFDSAAEPYSPLEPTAPLLEASERVLTPWPNGFHSGATVQDAWRAVFHQLELQLDRAAFQSSLREAILVDFIPETSTFVVAVRSRHARDLLQQRLYRMMQRLLSDVYGHPAEAQALLREEWVAAGSTTAA